MKQRDNTSAGLASSFLILVFGNFKVLIVTTLTFIFLQIFTRCGLENLDSIPGRGRKVTLRQRFQSASGTPSLHPIGKKR